MVVHRLNASEHPTVVDSTTVALGSRYELSETDAVGVSLVIPAWNEETRLPSTLLKYIPVLESTQAQFEILVVADGVTDQTIGEALKFRSKGVRVVEFERRLGKGGAIIAGMERSRFTTVGFVDADGPVTAASLAALISSVEHQDGVIASRWLPGSLRDRGQSPSRLFFSKVWNVMTRTLLGLNVRDSQCGAKFFKRQAIMQVLPRVTLTNWAFDACLLFHFERQGFKIVEIPVNWSDNPNTKLNVEKVVPAMFLSLIGIRLMSVPALQRSTHKIALWFFRRLT